MDHNAMLEAALRLSDELATLRARANQLTDILERFELEEPRVSPRASRRRWRPQVARPNLERELTCTPR